MDEISTWKELYTWQILLENVSWTILIKFLVGKNYSDGIFSLHWWQSFI